MLLKRASGPFDQLLIVDMCILECLDVATSKHSKYIFIKQTFISVSYIHNISGKLSTNPINVELGIGIFYYVIFRYVYSCSAGKRSCRTICWNGEWLIHSPVFKEKKKNQRFFKMGRKAPGSLVSKEKRNRGTFLHINP